MYNVEYLCKIIDKFWKEANKCYENKCYLACMILYGAVLEALLLAMCFVYQDKVRKTNKYQEVKQKCIKKKIRKRGFMLEFTLSDLLKIGEELKWLPMKEKIEDIGLFEDWVQWVKETRNLIHPARWLKPDKYFGNIHKLMKGAKKSSLKKFVNISEETVDGIRILLLGKIERDLRKKLNLQNKLVPDQ